MLKSSHGFTMTELLLSSIIMGFIFTSTIIVYIMLDRIWKEDLTLNELVRDANIAVEKITRGVHGNEGLQAAKSITSPIMSISSGTVQYADLNGTSRTFYYSNGKLYAGSGEMILSNVVSAAFSNIGDRVLQIDIVTHKYVLNKEIKFQLQTKIKLRNS